MKKDGKKLKCLEYTVQEVGMMISIIDAIDVIFDEPHINAVVQKCKAQYENNKLRKYKVV